MLTDDTLGDMTDTSPTSAAAVDRFLTAQGFSTQGTLLESMGIEMTTLGAELCTGRMPVAGNTQPMGLLHGGASAALAETLGSYASMVHAGPGMISVGIELNASHHRSATEGWVVGTARAQHLGRTLTVYNIEVRTETGDGTEGKLLCTARLTCLIRPAA